MECLQKCRKNPCFCLVKITFVGGISTIFHYVKIQLTITLMLSAHGDLSTSFHQFGKKQLTITPMLLAMEEFDPPGYVENGIFRCREFMSALQVDPPEAPWGVTAMEYLQNLSFSE